MQAHQRLGTQVIQPPAGALRGVSKGLECPAPGKQQVAFDQVCQTKIGFGPQQRFYMIECQIEVVALDLLEYLPQKFVGALFRLGRG